MENFFNLVISVIRKIPECSHNHDIFSEHEEKLRNHFCGERNFFELFRKLYSRSEKREAGRKCFRASKLESTHDSRSFFARVVSKQFIFLKVRKKGKTGI